MERQQRAKYQLLEIMILRGYGGRPSLTWRAGIVLSERAQYSKVKQADRS